MKDETVGTGGTPSDDFDLDSFLRENDFLTEDPEKQQEGGPRPTHERPWSDFGRLAPKSSNRSPSKLIPSPEEVDAEFDLNKTMSYEALGEDYPEIPLIEEGRLQKNTSLIKDKVAKQSEQSEDSLQSLQSQQLKGPQEKTTQEADSVDPNDESVAVNYPSSEESAATKPRKTTDGVTSPAAATDSASSAAAATTTAAASSAAAATTTAAADANPAATSTLASNTDTSAVAKNKTTTTKSKKIRSNSTGSAASSASTIRKQSRTKGTTKAKTASRQPTRLATLANPDDFRASELTDNTYRIRGGGTRHNRRSPIMVILIAVVIIAGIGLLGYAGREIYYNFMIPKEQEVVVYLTPSQTRAAIDEEMPFIIDYLWYDANEACDYFKEAGWNVIANGRATSDNPDFTASGSEIIRLDSQVSDEVLTGYYESEFNAYDFDELQESFNGTWMFDISHGDQGEYGQLKYVNFASESLDVELEHIRSFQGLIGSNSVVDKQDVDDFGNTFVQGYTVIGETTYYWKVIGISFKEYYRGQDRRPLPNTAVYVKCTVATFDFFGISETTTEATNSSNEGNDAATTEEEAATENTEKEE